MDMLPHELWRDLIGVPFKHRGRGPKDYDCYGLVLEISRRQGIILFDTGYPDDIADHVSLIKSNMYRWERCDPQAGAVLLFRQGAMANHVGVQIDQDRFIHATEAYGQVKLDRLSRGVPPPINLLVGAYKYVQSN